MEELIELLGGDGGFVEIDDGINLSQEDMSRSPVGGEYTPGVSPEELQSILKASIDQAVDYAEEELAAQRKSEQEYYDGDGFEGDDKLDDTRSTVVSRDVHDTVKAIMPSLLRIFFSGKNAVAYDPTGPEDEAMALQATDYVNDIVLRKDNKAFELFYNIFMDALTKALGTVAWHWERDYEVVGQRYEGLTLQEYLMVTQNLPQGMEVTSAEATSYMDPEFGELFDCEVKYKVVKGGKVILDAIPPEERLINKQARSIDDSTIYGRRRVLTVSEVVAMGFNYEQVVRLGGSENLDTNEEQVLRYDSLVYHREASTSDPSMRTLEYCDIYLRVDLDGDGFAELYRIACGGTRYTILEYAEGGEAIELVDEIPYAEFCPDPIPHLATGNSVSASVMDIQRIKSNLLRGALDSLSRSIFPREEVVATQVNMNDVLNPEIGAIIRTKQPGMIREITTPFMGKEAMPMLGYMDEVKANRTGISDTTQGLNPQMLQSTTPGAVSAAVGAAQMQIEMIARLFASIGMSRMFCGILKLIKTHQDKARVVKMKGSWAEVDPRFWNIGMDATVNTALGRGTEQERMTTLSMVADKQEKVMAQLGPNNPLVNWEKYRNTLAEMVTLAGYPNADKFYLPVEQGQMVQQFQQEMEQVKGELQQAQQMVAGLQFELQNHTAAEDAAKHAKAFKDRTDGLGNIVDAAQTAQEAEVNPGAMGDEIQATGPFLQ